MRNLCLTIVAFLIIQIGYSQEGMSFRENNKLYLRGNSILIGNNILSDHASKPLNDVSVPNDITKMKYIDVDNDKRTFSSSQATINVPNDNSKIAYAALYWSALYPYESGVLRKSGDKMVHRGQGSRDPHVDLVLFKMPNDEYKMIKGDIVFDSFEKGIFPGSSPYVCYADVTEHLQKKPGFNGTYTVADIRATEGNISGGSSAGWLLYIVYENPLESPKYFTTYNGLVEVNKKPVEITFKDFKTKKAGDINTTIAIGSLEGDRKLKTDQCAIYNSKTNTYENISNSLRDPKNFFNSSITTYSEIFNDRNPNNINTLGFDLLKIEVPNSGNQIIDSNTTKATLKFQTKADRFYLFFAAFETEINNAFYREKRGLEPLDDIVESTPVITEVINTDTVEAPVIDTAVSTINETPKTKEEVTVEEKPKPIAKEETKVVKEIKVEEKPIVIEEEPKVIIEEKPIVIEEEKPVAIKEEPKAKEKPKVIIPKPIQDDLVVKEEKTVTLDETDMSFDSIKIEEVESKESVSIPSLTRGYYLITNVFSIEGNAKKWTRFLKEKGYTPLTYINPENNWHYVYIFHSADPSFVYLKKKKLREMEYFKKVWIAKINI